MGQRVSGGTLTGATLILAEALAASLSFCEGLGDELFPSVGLLVGSSGGGAEIAGGVVEITGGVTSSLGSLALAVADRFCEGCFCSAANGAAVPFPSDFTSDRSNKIAYCCWSNPQLLRTLVVVGDFSMVWCHMS